MHQHISMVQTAHCACIFVANIIDSECVKTEIAKAALSD